MFCAGVAGNARDPFKEIEFEDDLIAAMPLSNLLLLSARNR